MRHSGMAVGLLGMALDPDFAKSLAGKKAKVRITYLDQGDGAFIHGVLPSGRFYFSPGRSGVKFLRH